MDIICNNKITVSTDLMFLNNDIIDVIIEPAEEGYLLKNEDLINEIYNEDFLRDLKNGEIRFDSIHYSDECFFKKVKRVDNVILNNFAKEIYAIQFLSLNYN